MGLSMKVELTGALRSVYRILDPHRRDAHRGRVTIVIPTICRYPEHGEVRAAADVCFEVSGREEVDGWLKTMESKDPWNVKVTIEIPEPEEG